MTESANNFGVLTTSLFNTPFGALYIAVISLALNLATSFGGSYISNKTSNFRNKEKVNY